MMYWHAYHYPYLMYWVSDYDDRVKVIKEEKPQHEQVDRLKWFKVVKGKLPAELVEAAQAGAKAQQAWVKIALAKDTTIQAEADAAQVCHDAEKTFRKIYRKHQPAIEKLHAKECPGCSWDGMKLVFGKTG